MPRPDSHRVSSSHRAFWLFGLALGCSASGCAGPHTPLGAVWTWRPVSAHSTGFASESSNPAGLRIRFLPSRQVLHSPSPWRIQVEDVQGDLDHASLRVRYQGFDVTQSFLRRARMRQLWKDRLLVVDAPFVRLDAESTHPIEVSYQSSTGLWAVANFEPPTCSMFTTDRRAMHTGDFEVSRAMLEQITRTAREAGFSPSLLTGLIAQESRFDPRTVSWARALGLTQITGSAESEIAQAHTDWPRYAGLEQMDVGDIRRRILLGEIHRGNEWRLDPVLSIRGGVEYTRQLAGRWSEPENLAAIRATFSDPEVAFTQLVLASYHSGYARVAGAFHRRGRDWLGARELREARKYVNRVFSYCHHFSEPAELPPLPASAVRTRSDGVLLQEDFYAHAS